MLKNKPGLCFFLFLFLLMRCTPDVNADTKKLLISSDEVVYYCDYHYDVSDLLGMDLEKWYEHKVYTTFNTHFFDIFNKGYLVVINKDGWIVEQYNGSILKVYKGD